MTGTVVRFVRLVADTASVLDAVAAEVFDDDIDPALVETALAAGQLIVVALDDGSVVGQVQGMIQHHVDGPPELYIDNLGVSPKHRRRGIARRLVDEVVAWSTERGCGSTWIVTEPDNEAANALYGSLGAQRSTVVLYSLGD